MAFKSGSYKMPPRWEHYHGGLGMVDKPMPVTQWKSPRRATMNYNKSGYNSGIIDMVQRNGVHSMESNSRAMLRKIGRQIGKRFPLVWAAERAFDAFYTEPGTDLATPARVLNGMWYAPCNGPETVCEQLQQPQWYSSSAAFCWNGNEFGAFVDNVAPGAVPHGFKWFWRCDLRGTQYEWYGQGWIASRLAPWWDNAYGRDWPYTYGGQPDKVPLIDPNLMPEAQPIDHPQVHPQRRPYWATPVSPGRGLNGHTAGYTPPGVPVPPSPPDVTFPPHEVRPPGPGEKENKKNRMAKWMIKAIRWAMVVTEVSDAVNAIADGLGWGKLNKPGEGKIPFIYRMWDKMTPQMLEQVVLNLLRNEAEDKYIGRLASEPIVVPGVGTIQQMGNTWVLTPWN